MHSAKGLEWRVVFVIQAIDGCIPMVYGFDDDDDKLDEELRLMYVAVTRAKEELFLVYPRETARGYGFGWAGVSRFIEAVPDGLVLRRQASELLAPRRGRRRPGSGGRASRPRQEP
jgi:DNA helicase-2/ATP-dependent DNA helicase PcrA